MILTGFSQGNILKSFSSSVGFLIDFFTIFLWTIKVFSVLGSKVFSVVFSSETVDFLNLLSNLSPKDCPLFSSWKEAWLNSFVMFL